MRRSTVPAALAALAVAFAGAVAPGTPALAAAVFVETNPSTVPAGDEIGVRASCDDNLNDATVTSTAFGSVTVRPSFGFLTATVRVPAKTKADNYRVRLKCPGGEGATTTLHVVAKAQPTRGPATGGGGTAGGDAAAALLIGAGLAAMAGGLTLAFVNARRRRFG
jgi:hypothetical protein